MKYVMKLSFRNKRRYFLFIILFLFSYLIVTIFSNNLYRYNKKIIKLEQDRENLALEVNINSIELLPEIKELTHYYYPIYPSQILKYKDRNIKVNYFNNVNNSDIISEELKDNEIILSNFFNEDIKSLEGFDINTIELTLDNFDYKFEVVNLVRDSSAHAYISLNSFEKIFKLKKDLIYIMPKDYVSYQKLINILNKEKIQYEKSNVSFQSEIDNIKFTINMYLCVLIIIMFIMIAFIYFLIKNILFCESKDIAIFKVSGYNTLLIQRIIIYRMLIILFLSFFIFLFISIFFVILKIINISFLNVVIINFIFTFIIIFIIYIVIMKQYKYIKEMNVVKVLEEF